VERGKRKGGSEPGRKENGSWSGAGKKGRRGRTNRISGAMLVRRGGVGEDEIQQGKRM
jgi:hypothetical protein